MMRNNGPNNNSKIPMSAAILLIVAVLLVVGVLGFAVLTYSGLKLPAGIGIGSQPTAPPTSISNGYTPVPGGSCNQTSPYGFTTIHADSSLVTVYKQLNVCWVRYQYHWDKIERQPNVYTWTDVDTAIATMNAAHIYVDFAIQYAPTWDLVQSCFGTPYLTGPSQMAQFATALATRYDGKHGHGKISSYEIGNEEYDQHFSGNPATSEQCRQASNYGPVLKAGYQAIKAVSPDATVGMFGQWYRNINHIQKFFTDLYTGGYGPYMDYMNFHFYNGGQDPSVSHGSVPSFDLWWQTMHDIATQHGFANKPIWVTEVGWPTHQDNHPEQPVTPQVQAQYLQYIMDQAEKSNAVQKVFWFTINYGDQADNIAPPSGPLPAFHTYQQIVYQRSQWHP